MKGTNLELDVVIADSSQKLAQEALELFVGNARKAIETTHRFCVALSRYTPETFFELLGAKPSSKTLPWDKIHLFWVDECCGSSDLENNNCRQAIYNLIPKVGIPVRNVHRICSACRSCEFVASIYEQTIYNVVRLRENGVPKFDLIMLQMGSDAHIASLFPDTYTFFDTRDLVRVIYFMDSRRTRITLTHRVLYAASHLAVLVCGEQRAEILREVFTSEPNLVRYPVHTIWPILDRVTWLIDRNAAKFLLPPYRTK